jgi:uncharacterized damage-inducible protein DinB
MKETERIADQLKRAHEGNAWHGPSLLELLQDVSAPQAAAHPIAGAHSIWELVLHITAWESAGHRRLAGDRAELAAEENFPSVSDTSEKSWTAVKDALKNNRDELRNSILAQNETRLDEPVLPGMSTVYVTLQGVVQHSLYHAGQIAILKKALAEEDNK